MSGEHDGAAEAETRRRRRRISPIWLVPLAAILIAGYLGWRTYSDRGPLVTVTFRDAAGLTAGPAFRPINRHGRIADEAM